MREQLNPPPQVFVNGKPVEPGVKPEAEVVEVDDRPRTPKPATCIAYGDFHRSSGDLAMAAARKETKEPKRRAYEAQANEQYSAAKARYEQALKIDPKDMSGYLGLARVAAALGQHALAQQHYDRVLQAYPDQVIVHFEVGMMHARVKNWEPALAHLKRAAALEPGNQTYATSYGWALARAERFEDAWNVFRPLVGEAQAYYRLAQMTRHLGKDDLTRAYLTYAVQRDPNLQEAKEALAALDRPAGSGPRAPSPLPEPGDVVPAGHLQPQP